MQTADCRLQTADCADRADCADWVFFFYLYLNFLVKFLLSSPEGASTIAKVSCFLNFLDCWWSSLVSLCNSNRWLAVISSNLTDTDVIVVSSEDSGTTFVQLEDVEGVLMRIELDPPPCILGIFCLNFHWILSVRSVKSLPFFSYGTAKQIYRWFIYTF